MMEILNIRILIYTSICLVRAIKKNAVSFQKQAFNLVKVYFTWEVTQSTAFAWK